MIFKLNLNEQYVSELVQDHPILSVRSRRARQGEGDFRVQAEQVGRHKHRHPVRGACGPANEGRASQIRSAGHRDHHQLAGGHCQVIIFKYI